jgi:L-fuconolactonase
MIPDFPIADSHVHLCDPQFLSYGWMKGAPSLNRTILPGDMHAAATPVRVDRFVFIEVDVDPGQYLDEAAWVAKQAASDPALKGMVACLPLERGAAVKSDLDRALQYKLLRGIRRLIQTQPDPEFCVRPDFIAGLRLLATHDLPFDICIYHHQLPNVVRMVEQRPEVRFVLDHIGKPPIKTGGMDPWRENMRKLAAHPNVWCKISGVSTEADHRNWTRQQIRPYIEFSLETFGFDRSMYGSDWHVLELAGSYPDWVDIAGEVTAGCSKSERLKLFRENAVAFYHLDA